jgi:hypothetical protein
MRARASAIRVSDSLDKILSGLIPEGKQLNAQIKPLAPYMRQTDLFDLSKWLHEINRKTKPYERLGT